MKTNEVNLKQRQLLFVTLIIYRTMPAKYQFEIIGLLLGLKSKLLRCSTNFVSFLFNISFIQCSVNSINRREHWILIIFVQSVIFLRVTNFVVGFFFWARQWDGNEVSFYDHQLITFSIHNCYQFINTCSRIPHTKFELVIISSCELYFKDCR